MRSVRARIASPRLGKTGRMLLLSLLVGVVSGLGAIVFNLLLDGAKELFLLKMAGYQPPGLPREGGSLVETLAPWGRWLIPVATTLGGLVAGWLVFTFAPEAEGHGTDAVLKAYHHAGGRIRARVPLVKTVASALTIGSGGSGGREGPIAQIGAGFGSVLASVLRLSDGERRMLVMSGAAGGIGAIFHAPLGGALFVTEVLYRKLDYETDVLVPAIVSAVTAYSIVGYYYGFGSLFITPSDYFAHPQLLPLYALLSLVSAAGAWLFIRLFYGLTEAFGRWPLAPVFKPAVGGLAVGLLGIALPYVLDGGYGWLQMIFMNRFTWGVLLFIALGKMVATSFSIGSGGSGGVFGPSVIIGAALGGAVGQIFAQLFPTLGVQPVHFALVGMAAFFAAAAKTPLSSIVMVTEMTGSYGLLVPLMLSSFLAYLVLRPDETLYRSQVPERIDSPVHAHEYMRAALVNLKERGLAIPSDVPLPDVARLLETGQPVVLDPEGEEIMFTLELESTHPWVGRRIFELDLPPDVLVISVMREKADKVVIPRGHTRLEAGDRLILVGPAYASQELMERLAQEMEASPQAGAGATESPSRSDR
ncbi:chloride channel protein [Deinococcota bacterium DY0809b]